MGTPPFAVATLDALVRAGIDVAAVVTAPDRPAGRGLQARTSAVKAYALAHPALRERLLQPEKLRDPAFHAALDATGASLYIVVAFRMLPELVWARPSAGTINLHASLLPDYRGAAPINWAIMNGEQHTGVTVFFIRQEIDTGDVVLRVPADIGPEETAGELHDRLTTLGADAVVRAVHAITRGQVTPQPQLAHAGQALHAAPKLTPENCRLPVEAGVQRVHDHVRGLSPHPGAWAMWHEEGRPPQHFKVLRARPSDRVLPGSAGTVHLLDGRLFLTCGNGLLELIEVQAEGKRRMDAADFARGLRNPQGISLR